MLRYSKAGLQLTESFEGCRLAAYQDSGGVWTIGYGHTRGVYPGMTCTQAQAEAWLMEDLAHAERVVHQRVRVPLDQLEYDALVDFEFNTGALSLGESGCAVLRLLNAGDYLGASAHFDDWVKCKGRVLAGLMRRRGAEQALFDRELPRQSVN